jgi:hypothetical protein
MYIKVTNVPVFFSLTIGLNDSDAGKSITRTIGMVGHEISTFMGTNGTRCTCCHFRAPKSLDFQGPTLPMALVMDVARILIITSHAILKKYTNS